MVQGQFRKAAFKSIHVQGHHPAHVACSVEGLVYTRCHALNTIAAIRSEGRDLRYTCSTVVQ
jgi:hypothetical protein